jgi:type IV secretion system protein VirB10
MFVYSRGFGGAKYVEPKQSETAPVSVPERAADQPSAANNAPETEKKAQLIYTGLPPVTVHEGEMLEAVLVNRLLVNTEPSPVITHLSRDLFDASGQYVVFPANSRVIGSSQAVSYKGASRLFISFHRIILPNGLSIDLPQSQQMMKALDETGALGIVSNVNRHWMLQFGSAIFLGIIDGIAGYAQRDQADASHGIVISRTSENFDRVLDRVMSQYSSIVPTIRVDQGKTLRIYISDDMLVTPYSRISDRSYYRANF